MGLARTIFGWIFILYGIITILNAVLIFTAKVSLFDIIFPSARTLEETILLTLLPPEFELGLAIVVGLWGALWIWIGNKVRTGGQQSVRIG